MFATEKTGELVAVSSLFTRCLVWVRSMRYVCALCRLQRRVA